MGAKSASTKASTIGGRKDNARAPPPPHRSKVDKKDKTREDPKGAISERIERAPVETEGIQKT